MRKPAEFEEHPIAFTEAQATGLVRGFCPHVTDGDTFDVLIDLGFMSYAYETIRLHGADTPEIFRPKDEAEKAAGERAKARTEQLIGQSPVLLRSYRDRETFGRFVADVLVPPAIGPAGDIADWSDLAEMLIEERLARVIP